MGPFLIKRPPPLNGNCVRFFHYLGMSLLCLPCSFFCLLTLLLGSVLHLPLDLSKSQNQNFRLNVPSLKFAPGSLQISSPGFPSSLSPIFYKHALLLESLSAWLLSEFSSQVLYILILFILFCIQNFVSNKAVCVYNHTLYISL